MFLFHRSVLVRIILNPRSGKKKERKRGWFKASQASRESYLITVTWLCTHMVPSQFRRRILSAFVQWWEWFSHDISASWKRSCNAERIVLNCWFLSYHVHYSFYKRIYIKTAGTSENLMKFSAVFKTQDSMVFVCLLAHWILNDAISVRLKCWLSAVIWGCFVSTFNKLM